MNPYFPFSPNATYYYNSANNSGLSEEEAKNIFFGIYIDKGEKTDQAYISRIEHFSSNTYFSIRIAIGNNEVLYMPSVSTSINELTIVELKEYNSSGYHGWIALVPSQRKTTGGFIMSSTGGSFERFALSENIFNRCSIFDTLFNEEKISNNTESIDVIESRIFDDTNREEEDNLLKNMYKFHQIYKKLRAKMSSTTIQADIIDVPKTFPMELWGKKIFLFDKSIEATSGQLFLMDIFNLREVNNIDFSAWAYFDTSSGMAKRLEVAFGLGKMYPYDYTQVETSWTIALTNTTDYSNASENSPLEYTVSNSIIGEIKWYVDRQIILPSGAKLVHFFLQKDINIRYGNLWFRFGPGYVTTGNNLSISVGLVNPVIKSSDKWTYEVDNSAFNYGYSALLGDFNIFGKQGDVTSGAVKHCVRPSHYYATNTDINLNINNKGNSIDLEFTSESTISSPTNVYNNIFGINGAYYNRPFSETGKCFIQFSLDLNEIENVTNFINSATTLFSPFMLLCEGNKLGASNNYQGCRMHVLKITDDGMVTVRLEVMNAGVVSWGFKLTSYESVNKLTLYDFCVSEKPIDPDSNKHISRQRYLYPGLAGKTFTIFGDSEFNSGVQYLNVTAELGMPCFNAAYGGHKMAWAGNATAVDANSKSWLYYWGFRKLVLENPTDFYIFCVSTNDLSAASVDNDKQSIDDSAVQEVLEKYPSYGDSDIIANQKLSSFESIPDTEKIRIFNMSAVYCAYIEQILASNPKARIILANSPITCTGMLKNTAGADGKGQWSDGQSAKTARQSQKPKWDKMDELMRSIADKYNLPVLDFYHNTGLTYENYTDYCVDGTHWCDINDTSVLANTNPIANRESEEIIKYLKDRNF